MGGKSKKSFYCVVAPPGCVSATTGIYSSWEDACAHGAQGVSGVQQCGFKTHAEAEAYMGGLVPAPDKPCSRQEPSIEHPNEPCPGKKRRLSSASDDTEGETTDEDEDGGSSGTVPLPSLPLSQQQQQPSASSETAATAATAACTFLAPGVSAHTHGKEVEEEGEQEPEDADAMAEEAYAHEQSLLREQHEEECQAAGYAPLKPNPQPAREEADECVVLGARSREERDAALRRSAIDVEEEQAMQPSQSGAQREAQREAPAAKRVKTESKPVVAAAAAASPAAAAPASAEPQEAGASPLELGN